jgi:3-deoxy-manno-octulosonate cytidylyltransferase (CMP-KDO synthetase)
MKKAPRVLGVIPARLDSVRLPRKMLADIFGKPLICRTYLNARKAKLLDDLIVATDSQEIKQAVENCGGQAVLTSIKHFSGTDRVAEAVQKFKKFKPELIINIQGDEPVLSVEVINKLIQVMKHDQRILMGTVATPIQYSKDIENSSVVKVVFDKNNYAIYFSRSKIPFARNKHDLYFRHIGVYAFRRDFLLQYVKMKPTPLELAEGLEQLRVLENNFKIKVITGNFTSLAVDTKEDLDLLLVKQS